MLFSPPEVKVMLIKKEKEKKILLYEKEDNSAILRPIV